MNRKRMIIFGCGYVGAELAKAAEAVGYEVWVQSRNSDTLARLQNVPAERKLVSRLDSTEWHTVLEGEWDVAVNLVSSAGGGLDGYRQSYVEGNRSILQWAEGVSVRRFIYTSATSVYPQSDESWVREADVPDEGSLSPAGKILLEAENLVLLTSSIPSVVILRLAGIYGPGRHLYLDRLREGVTELPGDGTSYLNLIYLKDIIQILLLSARADSLADREVFNAVDDAPSRKQEIVDWLAGELKLPKVPFNSEMEQQRASIRKSASRLPNRRVSNERLCEQLGWRPLFGNYRFGYRDILWNSAQ